MSCAAFDAVAATRGLVAVLRSYEALLPAADELSIARRAADVVALGVYNDAGEGRGARVAGG